MGGQLYILSQKEIQQIYSLPKLNAQQRAIYFKFSLLEQEAFLKYRTPITRIYFILQLAYFRFKQQFFVFDISEVQEDVIFVQQTYFPQKPVVKEGIISKPVRLAQQKSILKLKNYRLADESIRKRLFDRACHLGTLSASPVLIFRDLINWSEQNRIVLPSYSVMQRSIVGKAITFERNRLEKLLEQHLTQLHKEQLNDLITQKIGHYYGLTWLKEQAPNFNPQSLRQETKRKETLHPLYQIAQPLLQELNISNENINYYAALAIHYTIGELRQFKGGMHYIFMLCFIQYRYQQGNDILAEAFKYYVRKYEAQAKEIAQDYFYKYHLDVNEQLGKLPMILELFVNNSIEENTPFAEVKEQVLDILNREKILLLTDFIRKKQVDETEIRWQHYETIQRQISYNLRHLFIHLDFTTNDKMPPKVMKAALFLKQLLGKGKSLKKVELSELPKAFIPKYLQSYIFTENDFKATRYELILYQSLSRQLEAGHIFIKDSINHQSLEADLIPLSYWKTNKEKILAQINLEKLFVAPQTLLKQLEEELENKIVLVNNAIIKGKNKEVSIKKKVDGTLKWQLIYRAKEEQTNHKIYQQFPTIGIVELLKWVNNKTNFSTTFKHILEKGTAKQADENTLIACLVALGTNHGISKMANCSDMDYNHLKRTKESFIRGQTLKEVNRMIVDATADLEIIEAYNLEANKLHSSSDGQKYPTRFDTFNARYSPKYFGLDKGISLNTMVLNSIPVNAKIFGANDHESHYVFDLIYNNPTKLKPNIHSTDTHGTNRVNFAILDIFGYKFAPRYRRFTKETEHLVGFKAPTQYNEEFLIKPSRKVNSQIFIDNWDMFQRIIASLAMKTTTQSTIVRKLSAFKRTNQYHSAFIEYNDIIKAIFMLDYIHSNQLKTNIQTVLNRGEAYQRMRKNISYAHDGKFQTHSIIEQNIWSECTRLISNAIIFYNSFLLSELLKFHTAQNNDKTIRIIKAISPIAWQHINLYGRFQFHGSKEEFDWKTVIEEIEV